MDESTDGTIEVTIFRGIDGVTENHMQAASRNVTPLLAEMPGFISRQFGASEDGKYIDIVQWADLESAKAAAEKVKGIPICDAYFGLIDRDSMDFTVF
ncbi:MAG: hypothetical protein WED00_11435 [Aquisalimonadaceae bacterium]